MQIVANGMWGAVNEEAIRERYQKSGERNMKFQIVKTVARLVAGAAILIGAMTSAKATLTIDFPMHYSSAGIVGTVQGFNGDNPENDASVFAQTLLNVTGLNTIWNDPAVGQNNRTYHNSSIVDYAGTIQGLGIKTDTPNPSGAGGTVHVSSGWEFAIAKYDGKNAGWVMFALGGQDAYIPTVSQDFWGDAGTDQYKISSFTVFNAVPEPTTMIAGALLLLPLGASTLRILRKSRKA
jgi:hypothetical protein